MGTKLSRKMVGAAAALAMSASIINPVAAHAQEPPVAPGMVRIDVPGIVLPGLPPGKMDVPRIPATPQEWEGLSAEIARALDEALRHLNWAIERQREALDEMNDHERALTESRNNAYETREVHGEDSDEYKKALEDFKKTRGDVEGAAEGGDAGARKALTDKDSRELQERGSSKPVIEARNQVAEASPDDATGAAAVDRGGYVVPEAEKDSEGAFSPKAPKEAPSSGAEARDPDAPKAPAREPQKPSNTGTGGSGSPGSNSPNKAEDKTEDKTEGKPRTTTRTTTKTAEKSEESGGSEGAEPSEPAQSDEEKQANVAAKENAPASPDRQGPVSLDEIEQRWAIQRSDFDPKEAVGSETDPARSPEQVSWTDADEAAFTALGGAAVLDLFKNSGLMDSASLYKDKFTSLKVDAGDGKAVETQNPMNNPLVAQQLPGCVFRTSHNGKVKYQAEVAEEGKNQVGVQDLEANVWFPELCDNEANKKIVNSLNHVMNATIFTDKDKSVAQLANDEGFKKEAIDVLNGESGNPATSRKLFDTMLRNVSEEDRNKIAESVLQNIKERGEAGGDYVPDVANSLTEGALPIKEHFERMFANPEDVSIVEPRGTFSKKMTSEMTRDSKQIEALDAGKLRITQYEREGDFEALLGTGLVGMTLNGIPLILHGDTLINDANKVKKAENKVIPADVVTPPVRTKFEGNMLENEQFENYVLNMAAASAVANTFATATKDVGSGAALFYKRPASEGANRHVGLDRNPSENQQAQRDFNSWRALYKKNAWWMSLTDEERANRETGRAGLDQQAQREQDSKAAELLNPNIATAKDHPVYGFGAYKSPVGVPILLSTEEKKQYGDLANVDALKFVKELSKNNEKGAILDSIRLTEDPALVAEKVDLIRDDITRLADQMYGWDDKIEKDDPKSTLILAEPGKGFNLTEQRPAFDQWFVDLVRYSGEITEKQVVDQGEKKPDEKPKDDKKEGKDKAPAPEKNKNDKAAPKDKNASPDGGGAPAAQEGETGKVGAIRADEKAIGLYFQEAEKLLANKDSTSKQISEWAAVRQDQTGIPSPVSSNDGVAYAASTAREDASGNDGPAVPMTMPSPDSTGDFTFMSSEPTALYQAVRNFDEGVMRQSDAMEAAALIMADPKNGVMVGKKILSNGWKPKQDNPGFPVSQLEGTKEPGAKVNEILRSVGEKLPEEAHQKIVVTISEASLKDMSEAKVKDEVGLLKRAAKEKWGEEPEVVMVMNSGKSPVTNSKAFDAIVASADKGEQAVFREASTGQSLLAHRLAFESTVKYVLKETKAEAGGEEEK